MFKKTCPLPTEGCDHSVSSIVCPVFKNPKSYSNLGTVVVSKAVVS